MIIVIVKCHDKLLEEKKNYLDNNRTAVRIIDEVVKKTVIRLSLDEKNNDLLKITSSIYPEEGQKIIEDR